MDRLRTTRKSDPGRLTACERTGAQYRDYAIAAAAARYTRASHVRSLLAATPDEIADLSFQGRRKLIARLLRLARNSARAGAGGHWSYDPHRHIAILGALQAERAGLAALQSRATANGGTTLKLDARIEAPSALST